jgi:hypothetical protein
MAKSKIKLSSETKIRSYKRTWSGLMIKPDDFGSIDIEGFSYTPAGPVEVSGYITDRSRHMTLTVNLGERRYYRYLPSECVTAHKPTITRMARKFMQDMLYSDCEDIVREIRKYRGDLPPGA